jgi:hypothetical protein
MTDKERLEMIKHDFEERGQYGGFIDDCDTLWLIEKVERYEKALQTIMKDSELFNTTTKKTTYSYPGKVAEKALES